MAIPSPALGGRNGCIWRDYCRGATQEKLAERYGLSQQRISQIIRETRDSIGEEVRTEVIQTEAELLRTLREEILAEIYDAKPVPVTVGKDGAVLLDPETGEVVRDHGGRLAAIDRVDRISSRLHRLLGIDAPAKLDLNLTGEEEKAKQAGAEAAHYLHGGESDPT